MGQGKEQGNRRKSGRAHPGANSTAQLALPGLGAVAEPEMRFDVFEFIRETFHRLTGSGSSEAAGVPRAPDVKVSRRMLRTLGSFNPTKNLIRLSARLLALGSVDEQRQVALHEVAHAVVHSRTPRARAHGREFRVVCRELGLEPGRYVNIDHTGWESRTRFMVECPGCGSRVLRRKRAARVRCDCGVALRPKAWRMVGISGADVRPV